MVSASRIAYLFYAVLKVAGYSLVIYFFLSIIAEIRGPLMYWVPVSSGVSRPGIHHNSPDLQQEESRGGLQTTAIARPSVLGPEGILH